MSEEGGTGLACRARSVRRSAVQVRRTHELFRGRTAANRASALRARRRVDELSDVLTLCSWARPLLTAVICVQLRTSCPTSRTISDREQATK